MNNKDYFLIQGWMINDLNLKGNDLLVYAIIYNYSKDGIHKYYGSLQYLADWVNSTIPGIQNNLKNLIEKNYIIKNKLGESSGSKCEYYANLNIQNSCIDIQQSCNNNIINNNLFISKDINKEKPEILEKNIYFENHKSSRGFKILKTWIELYIDNIDLQAALISWLEIMYSNKKIGNLEGLKNKIDFLLEELPNNDQRIVAVKDATNRCWFTFQYSVEKAKTMTYNIQGNIPKIRNISELDLSDEVF